MNSDIIEKLRENKNPHYLLDEAAAEIERLRIEISELRAEVQRLSQIAKY